MPLRIFLDSDVIVSSLISQTGAAYFLINNAKDLELFISNFSIKEIGIVAKRLNLDKNQLTEIINNKCRKIDLKEPNKSLKSSYRGYVLDINDAHIIAGAKKSRARFLVSYNLRHYNLDKIKGDFGIIILTPAQLLQYLRSL